LNHRPFKSKISRKGFIMPKHDRKVALVTGANRGIGFEISKLLALKGITVIMGARGAERGNAACSRLKEQGLSVFFQIIDVTNNHSIATAIKNIEERFSHLNVLINNAGILIDYQMTSMDLDPDTLSRTLLTNAYGPMILCQHCIPFMEKGGYGRVVNMASTLGSLTDITDPESSYGGLDVPAYRLSKTLLNGVTALYAKLTRGKNILVNSACPGPQANSVVKIIGFHPAMTMEDNKYVKQIYGKKLF
jgi:NAD(P)-dependent dehydrogenase (short-subunit alcohol dehydrogenase family)